MFNRIKKFFIFFIIINYFITGLCYAEEKYFISINKFFNIVKKAKKETCENINIIPATEIDTFLGNLSEDAFITAIDIVNNKQGKNWKNESIFHFVAGIVLRVLYMNIKIRTILSKDLNNPNTITKYINYFAMERDVIVQIYIFFNRESLISGTVSTFEKMFDTYYAIYENRHCIKSYQDDIENNNYFTRKAPKKRPKTQKEDKIINEIIKELDNMKK